MAGTTLGTAYVQIVPSTQGIAGSISSSLGGEAQAAGTSMGGKIGAFATKAFIAAGVGAVVYKTFKAAIDEGAKLQQSYLGGLDTLYGESADAARENARAAAQAGISMNTYAEQAVSFGAALKQSLGGDTVKAAKVADMAIMDMADNSAKMGTSIESLQMAYQGFAKQNYTMLDNLKLGYGGTKKEMERLLADAEKITGKKYDINNLADVYEAIHVIQGEVGLTGVAAEEASTTFSGAFAAMKASAENLLGSIALGEGVQPAMEQLTTSVYNFAFNNLFPMIGTILKQLPSVLIGFIKAGAPAFVTGVSSLLSSIATMLKEKASSITGADVSAWATENIPKFMAAAGSLIKSYAGAFIQNLPTIMASIGKIGLAIVKGLGSALWAKVTAAANGIKDKFLAPINALKDKIKAIIDKIKSFFSFKVSKPRVPLPHFGISPAGWKISDLLKGKIPRLSVKWYAQGGIVTGASLIGAGEAGSEAIVPLDPFWRKMDQIADSMHSGDVTINVYASEGMDVNAVARAVKNELIQSESRRRLAWQ